MNIWAKIILTLCTTALIIALVLYAFNVNHNTMHYKLEYTILTDSAGVVTQDARVLADSIFLEMRKLERQLEDKYEYAINQQSNAQDLLALGGLLMGVVVSIVGFFGYSTMQSIEEKARKIAENKAVSTYRDKIEELQGKKYKEYLDDNIKPEVDKKISDALSKYEGEKTASIDDLTKRLNILELAVSRLGKKERRDSCDTIEENDVKPEPDPFKS